jgi:putative endopeptidase
MDTQRLDAIGMTPLQTDLARLADIGNPAALGTLSARLEMGYGVSPLVNAFTTIDAKDSKSRLLVIYPGLQPLDREEYTESDRQQVRDLYVAHIAKMLQTVGVAPEQATADAQTIFSMESQIASARLTPLQQRDPNVTYNKLALAEVQAMIPSLDLSALLGELNVASPPLVQVIDMGGLKAVQSVLSSHKIEDVQSLLRWHILNGSASLLGQPWRGLDQEFNRKRRGLQEAMEREREVSRSISNQLFHPLSELYVKAYFPESTRKDITVMVGHIKDEFELRLRTNPWLDEPTRAAALLKLSKIDIQVGYPEHWIDFSPILIRADDHFGNNQRISEFQLKRDLARVGKPVVNERFAEPSATTPIAVNAAYNPQTNSIDITAAIVQPPFYVAGADAAVNYCTIGAVIGHEITHGFDSNGRQYGPAGNLRDWWTPQASAEFKKRTDVLVDQYSQFTILPGLKHNGLLTLTENTADLGGITLAYSALHRTLGDKPQPKIDGLTSDQRCFVAWAQMWAYKGRPERLRMLASADYHGNATLRGYVPLLHLNAFHKAFGIKKGDRMWRDPKKRVRIW